jgi:hypothetical protein
MLGPTMGFMEELVAGLLVTTAAASVGATWRRRLRIVRWLRAHLPSPQKLRLRMFSRWVGKQVKIAVKAAQANGQIVPLKRGGGLPAEVIFSDGSSSYYFSQEIEAYKRALLDGSYPRDRTFHTRPPLTLRDRSRGNSQVVRRGVYLTQG